MLDTIVIEGGRPLNGVISVSGSKNAGLPLMLLSVLTDERCRLERVPMLTDISHMCKLLRRLGGNVVLGDAENDGGCQLEMQFKKVVRTVAGYNLVSKMRASFWIISALLAHCGQAKVAMPGGCKLGQRPIELILYALRRLGATIDCNGGYVEARCANGLKGNVINFDKVSVGATHCAIIAASRARGVSRILNAACEPEIVAVADCLNQMGAKISGAGSKTITIQGVDALKGFDFTVPSDRIEAGSYAILAAASGGKIRLENVDNRFLQNPIDKLRASGATVSKRQDNLIIERNPDDEITAVDITTSVYPGFPTDLQAQFMALMTMAKGRSRIKETIFENRFMHVAELKRFGARIDVLEHDCADVRGVSQLIGSETRATDLRASMSLVIAALMAEGRSVIHHIHHLDRGFENLTTKLSCCGAQIERRADGFTHALQNVSRLVRSSVAG